MDLTLNPVVLPEIDLYCERETNDWLDEPLGLLSNSAFLAAAWHSARPNVKKHSPAVQWLIGVLTAIGIGSALFHAIATRWALLMDVIPIQLFILSALWILLRAQLQCRTGPAVIVMTGFLAVSSLVPSHVLNGSASYLPGLACVITHHPIEPSRPGTVVAHPCHRPVSSLPYFSNPRSSRLYAGPGWHTLSVASM